MRLPNGYGSVTKLSGKRRNPYQVKKTIGWTDKGYPKYLIIGYFPTRKEALAKLAEYNSNPYNLEANNYTVEDVWQLFYKNNNIASSTLAVYKSRYKNFFGSIKNVEYKNIRAYHIEEIMKGATLSDKIGIKTVFKALDNTALKLDIINKAYSSLIQVSGYQAKQKTIFTHEEVEKIYNNRHLPDMDIPLILLYTGMRIGELTQLKIDDVDFKEKIIIIRHSKTKAGTGRQIPIHDKIIEILREKAQNTSDYFYFGHTNYYLYYKFKQALEKLNINHHPHECRHTFRSRLDEANANKKCIDLLMGHKSSDVGTQVYTHKNIDDLRKTIELLK